MAYTINRYNGAVQATVQDGTINQSTEVKFIGKNYAGYGEAQNENFMFFIFSYSKSIVSDFYLVIYAIISNHFL